MPDITSAELQTAIAQLGPVKVRISGSDIVTDAVILYPGTIAGTLIGSILAGRGQQPSAEPGHAAEAARLLGLVDDAAGRAGRIVPADIGAQLAIGHALLAIHAELATPRARHGED